MPPPQRCAVCTFCGPLAAPALLGPSSLALKRRRSVLATKRSWSKLEIVNTPLWPSTNPTALPGSRCGANTLMTQSASVIPNESR